MSNNVSIIPATTASNELRVAQSLPQAQIDATYGILVNSLVVTDSAGSGAVDTNQNLFRCQTGTATDGLASVVSRRLVRYRAGQNMTVRISAIFSSGAILSRQAAGLITNENSIAFGVNGTDFGVFHARAGAPEIRKLTVTTAASGVESATVTIDGTSYPVTLTAGSTSHNAQELAEGLESQVPNWHFSHNASDVVAISVLPGAKSGTFSFSSSTAVASWSTVATGASPVVTFVPSSSFNGEPLPTGFDHTTGNEYQIQLQYGFGPIKFFVLDPETGEFINVHTIQWQDVVPIASNPAFRVGWLVENTGNNTNITVQGAEAAIFCDGIRIRQTPTLGLRNEQTGVGTSKTNILAIRNRLEFNGKNNRAEIYPLLISAASQTSKAAFFELIVNPTFSGDVDWQYVNQSQSIVEYSTSKVSVSGGTSVGGLTISGSSVSVRLNQTPGTDSVIQPGDVLCLAAAVSSGAASDMQGSMSWQEDL